MPRPVRMPRPIPIPILDSDFTSTSKRWDETSRSGRRALGSGQDDQPPKPPITGIVVAVVTATIVLIGAAVLFIRLLRRRHPEPKYIPTPFLKRLWTDWHVPDKRRRHHRYRAPADEDGDGSAGANNMQDTLQDTLRASETRQAANRAGGGNRTSTTAAAGGVDRNVSVRSVITLPAYNPEARDDETVLGRPGDRAGIDVVVELPTAEDEEALREDEMEALYQIRLARRRQIEARDETRQARREARARNDAHALAELRRQARLAGGNGSAEVEELRRQHEEAKRQRQRAVSSVSYHDVGVARADGTRIRANSTESERVGLLSDAASMAPSGRSVSDGRPGSSLFHRRDRSASSVLSIDTAHSPPGSPSLTTGGSRTSLQSGRVRSRASSGGPNTPRAGSSPEMIDAEEAEEADVGDANMPPHSPPGYDDVSLEDVPGRNSRSGANSPYNEPPPDYQAGPSQTRNQRLSGLGLMTGEEHRDQRRLSRGVGGAPQLPSLRLARLPQIVIEPSTALPEDDH